MLSAIPAAGKAAAAFDSSELFDHPELIPEGELHFKLDRPAGLRAIVAIHSTRLGPALGGCRCLDYPSTEAAIRDALRLARGMSYKAAITGLAYGGGKAVLPRPSRIEDRAAYFEAFGRFVETFHGRFLTAEDSGTGVADMDAVARTSRYVLGTSAGGGDPSPYTARGVRLGIEAAVRFALGRDDLEGVRVAVQGLGHVGCALVKELAERGAQMIVTDLDRTTVEQFADEYGARPVAPAAIYAVDCEVFAPCALGACLDDQTIRQLRARIVAGSANNQLAEARHALALQRRRILYAPDYVVNAGGLIQVTMAYEGAAEDAIAAKVAGIRDTLGDVFERAGRERRTTAEVADALAEERLYGSAAEHAS